MFFSHSKIFLLNIMFLFFFLYLSFTSNQHMFMWDMCWARVLLRGILAASKWALISFYIFLSLANNLIPKKKGKHYYFYLGIRCPPGAGSSYFMIFIYTNANFLALIFSYLANNLIPKKNKKTVSIISTWELGAHQAPVPSILWYKC